MYNKAKKNPQAVVFLIVTIVTFILYLSLIKSSNFQHFIVFSQKNFVFYFIVLVFLKVLGIVWPPIPGGLLTLGSIPVLGWFYAWLADFTGSVIGSSMAFYLGRKYGYKFLKMIFDQSTIDKISIVKMKTHREIEGIAVLKLFYGFISEFISYASGLLGIKYLNFLLGTLLASVGSFFSFYLANNIFKGENIAINVLLLITAVILFFRMKGRYFE